jgi:hypothetical protein
VKVKINVTHLHRDTKVGGGVKVEIHAFLITALHGIEWLPNPTVVSSALTEGLCTKGSVHFGSMKTAK